jgi:ketosteroid isomerase-like protein
MDPVDLLLAHEEIRQLVARYAVALDKRDIDTVGELYVEDVSLGGGVSGREALKAFIREQVDVMPHTILLLGTHLIEVESDNRARGVLYARGEFPDGDKWIIQMLQYQDGYERRDGKWYFYRRKHLLWYGTDILERPIGLPPAHWPRSQIGQGRLPELWKDWDFVHPGWPGLRA